MVSPPKSKGHARPMTDRSQYTNHFGCAATLRLPVKEFLVCTGKGSYSTSALTAKGSSEICDSPRDDPILEHLNVDANELSRTFADMIAGATSPIGQDTMQEALEEEHSFEAEFSMTELDQARREMVASAADRKAKLGGEYLHFFDRVQRRGVISEAGGERSSDRALSSELEVVHPIHSDGEDECKLGILKSDIRKPNLYKMAKNALEIDQFQRHIQNFPKNGDTEEGSRFVCNTMPNQQSGLLDGAMKSSVLKNICSKRKAPLNVDDGHLQRKYCMNEKNERVMRFPNSNESILGKLFHLDVNAEEGRNWTMALNSNYKDTKISRFNREKVIKNNCDNKKKASIAGTPIKLGSFHGICGETLVDLGLNRHVQRSVMRWVLTMGKCLGRTQPGFVKDAGPSNRLHKARGAEMPKHLDDYLDDTEKYQETSVRISREGEASAEVLGRDSSTYFAVKSSCLGGDCCNDNGNQRTLQTSGDRKPVDCKEELSTIQDLSSTVLILSDQMMASVEEQCGRLRNPPDLGEKLCDAEGNLQPTYGEAKQTEKIIESCVSVERNQSHHCPLPAMEHISSSILKKSAFHNAGALKAGKACDMLVEGYLVRAKLTSPNSQIRASVDSPLRNQILDTQVIEQTINRKDYGGSSHTHDEIRTDTREEVTHNIPAELNKRRDEIAPPHLHALPGVCFPADGSGDLPSPREIAEFAATMRTVKIWINQTSSQEKSQMLGNQVCKFCGCEGHSLYQCSETVDPELQELGRRACFWEENAAEVGKLWCLRCLGGGHWGAQCYQPLNVTAAYGHELNMSKEQDKKDCQSRDKLHPVRGFSVSGSLTNVQRTSHLSSLPTDLIEHDDRAPPILSCQSETKSHNRKSNVGQLCPAMPGPCKLANSAVLPAISNRGPTNLLRTKESIIEAKGEKDPSKHAEIIAKNNGESSFLEKSKKSTKGNTESRRVAQDPKTIIKMQFTNKKDADNFPALLQGTKENWSEAFLRSIPRKILSCVESTRLSRSDIWKYAGCLDFSIRLHGFFLRLRFGHWDEELGGTGYRMGRIKGAATKNISGKRKIIMSVDLGDIECIVDAKFVSNHPFSQLELFNWWCGMGLKSKSVPKDDELQGLFEQRRKWELE